MKISVKNTIIYLIVNKFACLFRIIEFTGFLKISLPELWCKPGIRNFISGYFYPKRSQDLRFAIYLSYREFKENLLNIGPKWPLFLNIVK